MRAVIDSVNANVEKPHYDFATVEGRQQALKDLGHYTGAVDGSWGPRSKGALVHCQRDLGLAADGVWGPKTERAIGTALRV